MRLRSSLLLLSLATAAPLLALSVLAGVYVFERENSNVVNAALARNRATLEAVDAQLRGTIDTLRALGTSSSLVRGNLEAFHAEAGVLLAAQPHWRDVFLSTADGARAVDARLAWGARLPARDSEPRSLETVIAGHKAVVGDLTFAAPRASEPAVHVRIPIEKNGRVAWVLTASVDAQVFQQVLTNQNLPPGWVSGLVGTDGRLIARVPPVAPGTFASAEYRDHAAGAREGWYRGNTLEGKDTYTAFSRSAMTGWSIGYAIPAEAIVGGARGASTLIAAGILLSVLSALLIGYWLSRRVATPIAQLVSAARTLGSEPHMVKVDSIVDEVRQLSRALEEASEAIRNRDQTLREHAGELTRANANKTRFLALLSHELRNPLAPLTNGLAILNAGTADPKVQVETRRMMERQLKHLTRLIEDLLDVGRIDRGQMALQLEPVLLERTVQAAIEAAKPGMDAKKQELVVRYSPSRSHVMADPVRLTQVFINLLGNASKYTPMHGRIEVRMDEEAGRAVVRVTDTGVGFSPADAERIWGMFVRLDRSQGDEDPGGLGIGLTVARSLVELHHGTIDATSDGPGRGATFTVGLPTCEATPPARTESAARAAGAATGRVLVADDNVDAAQSFAELLRMQGFDVREAHDGEEALRWAHEFRPHVVFLDLDMPRMTGIEVAMQLRDLAGGARPHMVALTGWGQESDLAAARAAGFDEHLTKPADPDAAVRIATKAAQKAQAPA